MHINIKHLSLLSENEWLLPNICLMAAQIFIWFWINDFYKALKGKMWWFNLSWVTCNPKYNLTLCRSTAESFPFISSHFLINNVSNVAQNITFSQRLVPYSNKHKHRNLTCPGMSGSAVTSCSFLTLQPNEWTTKLQRATWIRAVPEEDRTEAPAYVCVAVNTTITINSKHLLNLWAHSGCNVRVELLAGGYKTLDISVTSQTN